jgi:hypothetical protein
MSLPRRRGPVAADLVLPYTRRVPGATGQVVLNTSGLAPAVSARIGGATEELVDRARGLKARPRRHEGDAALERKLAQVALLPSRGGWPVWLAGLWVVIGHGRARARRAGRSSPGPPGLAKRPARAGLDGPLSAPCSNRGHGRPPPAGDQRSPSAPSKAHRSARSASGSASSAWRRAAAATFSSIDIAQQLELLDCAYF